MPNINRVLLKNVGHPRAFMKDLTLDFHGGKSTVVFADNGGGKSSLIALILAVLRPGAYDFLQGESEEKRRLGDYIPTKNPGHVIIEWIYENGAEHDFFLTGMMLIKRQNKPVRRIFYSLRYPENVSPQHITFDNFPLESETTYYSYENIIKQLKNQQKVFPDQDIRIIYDNIGEWQDYLDKNHIDTFLAKTQIGMNKQEGAQAAFLNFATDMEFIRFIVRVLHTLPEDKDIHLDDCPCKIVNHIERSFVIVD